MITAAESGWLRRLDARAVGVAAWRLGAGRARKEDPVSPAAGVICLAKPGDRVERGQPLLELRGDDESRFPAPRAALSAAIEIGPQAAPTSARWSLSASAATTQGGESAVGMHLAGR